MRILSIHNEYLIKGGEDESRKAEAKILEDFGHEVSYYTEHNSKVQELSRIGAAIRTIWSQESYKHVQATLTDKKHDVVHVQNFFPLISPSVYYAAKSRNVPVVQAIRNYRFLCSGATLFRDDHVCEICVKHKHSLAGIRYRCYRNDLGASTVVTSMRLIHNLVNSWKHVNMFVCISEFIKAKMIEGGFPADRICVKPNFVYPDPGASQEDNGYLLYVGRLQAEKGIQTLLDAIAVLKSPQIKLKIVGEGPLKPLVDQYSKKFNIELLGKKTLSETYDLIGGASALIVPSVWHEPFGRVVVEGFAKGTPVIGSEVGGISELIQNGVTGLSFAAGNASELAQKIEWVLENKQKAQAIGLEGRNEYVRQYTPEANYKMLMDIYARVL